MLALCLVKDGSREKMQIKKDICWQFLFYDEVYHISLCTESFLSHIVLYSEF